MTENTALRGHPGVGPNAEGIALVCEEGYSARYDDDRYTGVISRETHALYGSSNAGKIVVFRTSREALPHRG